jgi:hypothetical protein
VRDDPVVAAIASAVLELTDDMAGRWRRMLPGPGGAIVVSASVNRGEGRPE